MKVDILSLSKLSSTAMLECIYYESNLRILIQICLRNYLNSILACLTHYNYIYPKYNHLNVSKIILVLFFIVLVF